uniref:LNS2 domain-containing protein n=1 Tax=Caenorhabditis tropicalis TaxID=1561998 RepID=A0A1I7U2A9_9PELO
MDYALNMIKNLKYVHQSINPATRSGAIDVVVVEQPDGEYKSTPFHVRFGKYGVFSCSDNCVDIEVNGHSIDLKMKLASNGVAYFDEQDTEDPGKQNTEKRDVDQAESECELEKTEKENEDLEKRHVRKRSSSLAPETENSEELNEEPLSDDDSDENLTPAFIELLRLSSDRLKSLGLDLGPNELRFSTTTKLQGTSWCVSNIYLYKWYEQLVISDIDGTITKSDVLGHVIPAVGGTWAHNGVAELYNRIKDNGYRMIYLSSRAIGHSHMTKQYLKSVTQDGKHLPDGPVLLSPTSTMRALKREVIDRCPEEFKIAALTELKNLFPSPNPYYAGFGNRDTDVISYKAVAIPTARILIIEPSGTIKRWDSSRLEPSYTSIATDSVDYMFPPLPFHVKHDHVKKERHTSAWSKPLNHSNFTHWHIRPEDVEDEELKEYEDHRKELIANRKS